MTRSRLPSQGNLEVEMLKILRLATVAALLAAPIAVHAQGVIGGMQRGAAEGNAAAGPLVAIPAARWAARSVV